MLLKKNRPKSCEKSKATKGAKQCATTTPAISKAKEGNPSVVEHASGSSAGGWKCKSVDDSVIGYVHKLSPQKRNRKNTLDYATLVLQTEDETIDTVLYSKNKRPLLSDSINSHTPVKIRRFTKTSDGQKLIINDMTKVSIANQSEYSFQYKPLDFKVSSIKEILESSEEWDTVCICAKAVHLSEKTEVGGQKKLQLMQTTLADETASITADIWEQHTSMIKTGKLYLLKDLHVRIWNGNKKVSTTINSTIKPLSDDSFKPISVAKEDIQSDVVRSITVPNISFVHKVESSIACFACSRKVLQSTDSKFVSCDRCGSTMRIRDCNMQMCANVAVRCGEDELNLTIFQSTLSSVIESDLSGFDDEKIAHLLLNFENLRIKYNINTMVVTELALVEGDK